MKSTLILLTAFLQLTSCSEKKGEPLFNGKDLSGWYSYLAVPDSSIQSGLPRDSAGQYVQALGINNDIFNVFTVVEADGGPAIRISGEVFGILVTDKEYENYHLSLEFKWGEKKYAPRADKKRNSGVLYHSVGQEGAWGGVWMKSKECQVQETDIGDFIVMDTGVAVIPCIFDSLQNLYFYDEKGIPLAFTVKFSYCHKSTDYEKEYGEWNTLEIYTFAENSVHVVNGKVNMRAYHSNVSENGRLVSHTRGKIQIQSEGAEIYYRNIRIEPITEFPEGIGMALKKRK
jgi:hypothetical protein